MCEKRPKYGENGFKMAKMGSTWDLNGSKKGQKYQNRSKWSKTGSKWLKIGQRRVKWATMGKNRAEMRIK